MTLIPIRYKEPPAGEDQPGKNEPEEPTDQQCRHCGRWFSMQGISGHRDACPLAGNPYHRFDPDTGLIEYSPCPHCDRLLRLDRPPADQDSIHRYPCPLHSESPF